MTIPARLAHGAEYIVLHAELTRKFEKFYA